MEYSIQQLSRLSGVTTRTLRWYDEIGLLKPARVSENGYRHYGDAQVDRLQDILYYRALGVELSRIKSCLDDPSFDRLGALRGHLDKLRREKERLEGLIRSLEDIIRAQERNEVMSDEQKFEAFKKRLVEGNESSYGREARKNYGDAQVDEAQAAVMGLSREEYRAWSGLGEKIQTRLERAVEQALSPEGEEGRIIVGLHRRWLMTTMKRCDPVQHRGIANLYTEDERFTVCYDKTVPGCAKFLRDAVVFWAE